MDDEIDDVGGVVSDKPFKHKQSKKTRCTKIKCDAGDGEFIELEICLKNGKVSKCRES